MQYINGRDISTPLELTDTAAHVALTEKERRPTCQWKQLEVFIDGPYGAPAADIFEAEHAVLIAAGIGKYMKLKWTNKNEINCIV